MSSLYSPFGHNAALVTALAALALSVSGCQESTAKVSGLPPLPPVVAPPLDERSAGEITLRHQRDSAEAGLAQAAEADDSDAAIFVWCNDQLGEQGHSLEFYDTLAPDNPARVFLARQLVREFVALRRYPDAALGWNGRHVNRLVNSLPKPDPGAPAPLPEDSPHQNPLRELLDCFEALAGAGRIQEAQDLAARIASAIPAPGTLDQLRARAQRAGHPELPATQVRDGATAITKSVSRLTKFRQDMRDPAFREKTAATAKGRLDHYYGFLFQELNLPPDQLDAFKDLLVRLQLATFDAAATRRGEARPAHPGAREAAGPSTARTVSAGIAALLGPDPYARYRDYQSKLSRWQTVMALAESLRSTATPLSSAQAFQLVPLLVEKTPTDEAGLGPSLYAGSGLFPDPFPNRPTARVRGRASDFLSPPQLAALHQVEQRQEIGSDERIPMAPDDPSSAGQAFVTAVLDQRPVVQHAVGPQYPLALRRQGIQGQALVDFIVQPDGSVTDVQVISADQPEFGTNAVAAVRQWRFAPGRSAGVAVRTHMRVPMVFQLSLEPDGVFIDP